MIERAHGDPERSFLPGRIFCSPVDFKTQLADWLAVGIEIIADPGPGWSRLRRQARRRP